MKPEELAPLLAEVAEKAALEVRRVADATLPSGVVRIKGKRVLILVAGESAERVCALYVEALRAMDLSGVFVPPAVREALETR